MKTNFIQLIYLPNEDYMISIRGIIPKKDNPMEGRIYLSGNPINCVRDEFYVIKDGMVFTDSWNFPVQYLAKWLEDSGSMQAIWRWKFSSFIARSNI